MDGKIHKSQRRQVLAAKGKPENKERGAENKSPRKARYVDKTPMPLLVAGKEILGRKLSVFKNSSKNPVWVKGLVKEFDELKSRHKVEYELPLPDFLKEREEWLCLGKSMFMWLEEDWLCPFVNPTYSQKYTPQGNHAVGKRIRLFWTAMGKWYLGKVVEYDSFSGKHQIIFRDGDEKSCILRQEAVVWVDIPQLSSEAAICKMRAEEGQPVSLPLIRANGHHVIEQEQGSSSSQKKLPENKKAVNGKRKQGRNNASCKETSTSDPRSQDQQHSSGRGQAQTSGEARRTSSEARTAASGSKEVPGTCGGIGKDAKRGAGSTDTRPAVDDAKSASSSSDEAEKGLAEKGLAEKQLCNKNGLGVVQPVTNGQKTETAIKVKFSLDQASKPATEDASRKRCRLGLPGLAGSQQQVPGQPEAKRRPMSKLQKAPAKPLGRKPKKLDESRLGVRRQKTQADVEFEDACQAVMGARVEVWWEDDHCFYKGKLTAHDWYRKRLKILYDDGYEEFISPQKVETKFQWLTPRARTAGATDAVHAAFRLLQAANAGPSTEAASGEAQEDMAPSGMAVSPTPVASPTSMPSTADGSHLDALVPLRPSSGNGLAATAMDTARPVVHATAAAVPHPVDSTTRALPMPAKAPALLGVATPAGWAGGPLRTATPATGLPVPKTGLQAMVPPSSHAPVPQAAAQKPAEGVMTTATLLQQMLPAGGLAAGSPAVLPQTRLLQPVRAGSTDRRFAMTPEPGVQPARLAPQPAPQGQAAEGWKVSIVFRGNNQIFQGRILTYDAEKRRHQVLWADGEDEWMDTSREALTWHADRLKTTGFSAGLPAGQPIPKGHDLEGWRIAVYWKDESTFYQGTVEEYDSELDQHTVSYNDGDELCESLCGQIFKFVLPPTVQAVGTRRGSARKRADSSEGEVAIDRRPRRRQRPSYTEDEEEEDDDEDSEEEWGRMYDRKPTSRQAAQLARETSTPAVTTPRTCDIRRMNSKIGSLLVYEGEENHIDVSPGNSPKFSPRATNVAEPAGELEAPDPRGKPVLERRITGLKTAQGFRISVKRVRMYLHGGLLRGQSSKPSKTASTVPATVATLPSQESLKLMLDRVDLAEQSIQKGIPVGSQSQPEPLSTDSGQPPNAKEPTSPTQAGSTAKEQEPALESMPATEPLKTVQNPAAIRPAQQLTPLIAPGSPLPEHQEEHLTPPPSPFATFATKEVFTCHEECCEAAEALQHDSSREQSLGVVPASKDCSSDGGSRAVPVLANGSLSLPQTPSAISEAQILAPDRNGSIISAPILAELAQARVALPSSEEFEKVAA